MLFELNIYFFKEKKNFFFRQRLRTFTTMLTHSLVHHFETVPNSNKLQTTTEMWLLKDFDCIENIVEKGEIAHFEQFHLFLQCFPKAFFFNVKMSIIGTKGFTIYNIEGK